MQLRTNVNPQILTAISAMLAPAVPEISPQNLIEAIRAYGTAPAKTTDRPLTRQEAAAMLAVSVGTIDNYIRRGLLASKTVGGRLRRIDPASVKKLIDCGGNGGKFGGRK